MQSRLEPYFTACAHRILRHLHETGIFFEFVKDKDIPMGPSRWLTVSSPEGSPGVALVLEPMSIAPAQTYQKALCDAGIPATAFFTEDIQAEFARLK
jgi:hypothetical protein